MRHILTAFLLLLPTASFAADQLCWLASDGGATSIAAGAITTAELTMVQGGSQPSATTPKPTYLKILVSLTDADNGVSNLRFSFTATETAAGTYGNVPLCAQAADILTCGAALIDWDPTADGKIFWLKPIDWGYPFGKITVTPTGHGAGDTVELDVYGCRE